MDKKLERMLDMYMLLKDGNIIRKSDEAERYLVSEKTIERDLKDLKSYVRNMPGGEYDIIFDRRTGGYRFTKILNDGLTNSEIFAVCKILLESRSMTKNEMVPILDKLLKNCVPTNEFKKVEALISNEKYHYIEPHHKKEFIEMMWDIATSVYEKRYLEVYYEKPFSKQPVKRLLKPVGIMFSEFYFYLAAFICRNEEIKEVPESGFPTIYRIDRIRNYLIKDDHFFVPYKDRFEEGEFRKKIQFMTGGELRIIRFLYKGRSLEAILDRLPTAEVIEKKENGYVIRAEVYGSGVDRWILSQGDDIEIIRNEIKKE